MGIQPEAYNQIVPYNDTLLWSAEDIDEAYRFSDRGSSQLLRESEPGFWAGPGNRNVEEQKIESETTASTHAGGDAGADSVRFWSSCR